MPPTLRKRLHITIAPPQLASPARDAATAGARCGRCGRSRYRCLLATHSRAPVPKAGCRAGAAGTAGARLVTNVTAQTWGPPDITTSLVRVAPTPASGDRHRPGQWTARHMRTCMCPMHASCTKATALVRNTLPSQPAAASGPPACMDAHGTPRLRRARQPGATSCPCVR